MQLSKITLGLLICLAAAGCTRDNDIILPPDAPVGGKGGRATLKIIPRHHGKNIDSCTIKLLYDANNFDNTRAWSEEKKVRIVDGKPTAIFDSLAPGNYFLYAEGWDPMTELTDGPADVYGSGPFIIRDSSETHEVYMDVNEHLDHVNIPHD